jgi:predicted RNA binding protein YcfA (HicA-like mRNA interferase family)
MRKLSNVTLKDWRSFLNHEGCKNTRNKGGHEHYTRSNLPRPITIQSHIDPVPERIIKQGLSLLNKTKDDLFDFLEGK